MREDIVIYLSHCTLGDPSFDQVASRYEGQDGISICQERLYMTPRACIQLFRIASARTWPFHWIAGDHGRRILTQISTLLTLEESWE